MPIKNKNDQLEEEDDILIQGEGYEEEDYDEDDEVIESDASIDKKKMAIIIAGVLVLIGVVFLVAVTVVKSKDKVDEKTTAQPASVGPASKFEDSNNNNNQNSNQNQNQGQQGTGDSRVDQVLNQSGMGTSVNGYSETDLDSLRAAGYTGPEIEQFQKEGKALDELLVKAKVDKDKFLQDRYKELDKEARTSEASDAYKNLRDYTWLSGEPKTIVEDTTNSYTTETVTYNASFEKIPLRGNQCLVKLYLDKDKGFSPAFINLHPDKFAKLKDTGNMVIQYDVVTYNNAKYVANIKEIEIS